MKKKESRTSKIDYTLMRRRRIIDFLEEIKQMPKLTSWKMNQKMEELLSMGAHVPSILLDLVQRCDDEILEIIAYALEYFDAPEIVDPLIDILVNTEIREAIRLRLLATLATYGVDTSNPEFAEIVHEAFDNIEEIMEQSIEDMLAAMHHNDEAITFLLENYQQFPHEGKMDLVQQFGEKRDERAVRLLKVLALLDDPQVAEAAISYLGRIKSPVALSALDDIAAETPDAERRKSAKKSAQRLKLMEVQPQPATLSSPDGEMYKVILSFFDGTGSRILWFSRYVGTDKSSVELMNLMLRTGNGVVDCHGSKSVPTIEFDQIIEELREGAGGGEVSYEYGLRLLCDALWQNQENAQPVPPAFFLWKYFFRNGNLSPEPYIPSWLEIAPNLELLWSDSDMLEESYALHELDEFINWFDHSNETYYYYEKLGNLLDRYNGQRLEQEINRLLKRYANDVFEPQRDLIRRNLEYSADFLFRQSGHTEEAEVALAAALHLDKQSVVSLDEHPFILRMMEESLERASQYDS